MVNRGEFMKNLKWHHYVDIAIVLFALFLITIGIIAQNPGCLYAGIVGIIISIQLFRSKDKIDKPKVK